MLNKKGNMKNKQATYNSVENCNFTGVSFDGDAIKAVELIATALNTNASALLELSRVFKICGLTVNPFITIGADGMKAGCGASKC